MAQIYVFTILVLIVLGLVYFFYLRDKFQKAVIGHVWATFRTKTGSRIDALCEVNGNIVTPPSKLLGSNPASMTYIVDSNVTDNFSYPPLFPRALQATVDSVIYDEGNPEPLGKPGGNPILTDKLIYNLSNEQATGLTMKGLGESLRADEEATGGDNKTVLYICLALLAGLGIIGFFVFQLSGQVSELLSLYEM